MTRGLMPDLRRCWRALLILVLAAARSAYATDPPRGEGEPFLQYFSPRDYHAGTQCLCMSQDSRGVMYVGNLGVVLEYDGTTWRKIPVGEGNAVAGMAYDAATDRMFVGTQNNVGYLQLLPNGARTFVSLLGQLPAEARDVGSVYGVYATPGGVFFVGTSRVMRWRGGGFKTWKLANTTRLRSDWAAGSLYVSSPEIGLLRLENEVFVPASTDPLFHRASVRSVLTDADGTLLVGTYHDGLFTLRDGVIRRLESDCSAFLTDKGIYKILRLRDGSLAIVTDTAGLLVLDAAHRFRNRLDEAGGLHGNNALNLFEDAEEGLWIGLQAGIVRAEITSPLSVLRAGPNDELSSTFFGEYWFGTMVLGNYIGLYRLVPADPAAATGAHLERMPGITRAFNSTSGVENGLLTVAEGKLSLLDAEARLIPVAPEITGAMDLHRSRLHPGRVFVSDEGGHVNALHCDPATHRWLDDGIVADIGKTGQFGMLESPAGDLWLGTKEHGLYRARLASAGRAAEITSFFDAPGPLQGVPFVLVSSDGGPLIFQALDKLCCLDGTGRQPRLATQFGERFTDGSLRLETVLSYDAQSIWVTARNASDPTGEQWCGRIMTGKAYPAPSFQAVSQKVTEVLGEVRGCLPMDISPAPLTTLLLVGSTGNGVVRLDVPRWEARQTLRPFATLIRRAVTTNKRSTSFAANLPILREPLPYAQNSVHFEFASGTLAFGASPRFQTRLVDFGAGEWSDFSDRADVDYLNLPEGNYTFEVRARNSDGQLGGVASLPFRILPPWQRTPWAYTIYALALALGLYVLVRWRSRQLRRRNATLEALVDARTSELRKREADLLANESALVRARDDAETANRAKSAFLANMSHELRTPLNAILGYAQIMLKQADLPMRSREQVTVIGRSGGHLLSMINEVLDLSKIEAGKLSLSHVDFSLPQLLDEVGTVFRPRFADKGITFTETRAPGLPAVVKTDPGRLRQVLFNLLGNAAKFTHRGGVSLDVRPTDVGWVRFEVVDTGVGIVEGELRDIFQAFHQVGDSRLASQGTGLGLAISQRLVGLLGGQIEVKSAPGEGSRFWFDLPLPAVEAAGGLVSHDFPEPPPGQVSGYAGAPRRLLLVDDVAENRRILRDFLQPLGFEIEEAADGPACLAACARCLPDAVLLDLRLGVMDGYEVARALRARTNGSLGIIAISASVFESDRQQAVDAGCDDFLPKPFEEAQLLATLGRVLGLSWVQAEPAVLPPSAAATPVHGEAAIPPQEITALLELSLRGDVVGIRRRLDTLRSAGAPGDTAAFVRGLEPLVAAYDMDRIHAFLLKCQVHAGS